MPSPTEIAARTYVAAWQEPDPAARARLIDACFAAEGRIVSPGAVIRGRAALAASIDAFFADPGGLRAPRVAGPARGLAGRLRALPAWVLLVTLASLPFVPGAIEVARGGVPDLISVGDRAALELRVLRATHGTQLLGPYSRFKWSHPGP